MKIPDFLRSKIKHLSLVLMLLVLIGHSPYLEAQDYVLSSLVQSFVVKVRSGISTPLFFTISGFLFFISIGRLQDCFAKIRRRVRTLLVPYLLWNVIFILWYVLLRYIPSVSAYINSDIFEEFTTWSKGLYFLWLKPASFPLWYLRDLMVYVLFSPLLYWLIRNVRWCFFGILLLLTPVIQQLLVLDHFELVFFVFGGTLAICGGLEKIDHISLTSTGLALFVRILVALLWTFYLPEHFCGEGYLNLVLSFCGMIVLWRGYDWFLPKMKDQWKRRLDMISNYTFFIYLFHEPAFNIVKKIPLIICGINDVTLVFFYLVNPLIMLAFAIIAAKILQRFLPSVYSVLVGGR